MNPSTIRSREGVVRSEMGLTYDRPIDMEPHLYLLEDTRNPNFEMISRKIEGGKVAKKRMEFYSRRRDLLPNVATVTAASAVSDTSITVDRFDLIHRNCLLVNTRTRELYLNNENAAVAPDASVEVRSYSNAVPGTASLVYATQVGDIIQIAPESHAEGDDFAEAFGSEDTQFEAHIMQSSRRAAQITDIAENEAEYDPIGRRAQDNKLAMIEFMKGINLLMYISIDTREVVSANGARRHAMAGLRQLITTNRQSLLGVNGGFSPQLFGEILRRTKYQGAASQTKLAMVGQNGIAAVSAWPVNYIRTSPLETKWGADIKTVITPHGNIDLAYDPVLTQENGLADIMCILDLAYVRQVYLQNMGLQIIKKVSNLSTSFMVVDGIKGTFGLDMQFEELHAWIEDIS